MFGRRRRDVEPADGDDALVDGDTAATEEDPRANGPWDATEVEIEDDGSRIDLGSLLVAPREGVELQLQVEETTGEVAAVILAAEDGAAEVRAFAAPRNGDIWESLRRTIAGEVAQLGGTASEVDGPWGTALSVSVLVDLPDGTQAWQPSTVVGIPGPRWLLRCTLFGHAAEHHHEDGAIESTLRDLVVVRGTTAVPPGDPLPLTLPPEAQPVG